MLERDGDDGQRWTCSICGRHAADVEGLTSNEGESVAICVSCVEYLRQSLQQDRLRPGFVKGWTATIEHSGSE